MEGLPITCHHPLARHNSPVYDPGCRWAFNASWASRANVMDESLAEALWASMKRPTRLTVTKSASRSSANSARETTGTRKRIRSRSCTAVRRPRRWPPTKTPNGDGDHDEGYGRVIWSPAADDRGHDGHTPLDNVISNPRVGHLHQAPGHGILGPGCCLASTPPLFVEILVSYLTLLHHLPPSKRIAVLRTR